MFSGTLSTTTGGRDSFSFSEDGIFISKTLLMCSSSSSDEESVSLFAGLKASLFAYACMYVCMHVCFGFA